MASSSQPQGHIMNSSSTGDSSADATTPSAQGSTYLCGAEIDAIDALAMMERRDSSGKQPQRSPMPQPTNRRRSGASSDRPIYDGDESEINDVDDSASAHQRSTRPTPSLPVQFAFPVLPGAFAHPTTTPSSSNPAISWGNMSIPSPVIKTEDDDSSHPVSNLPDCSAPRTLYDAVAAPYIPIAPTPNIPTPLSGQISASLQITAAPQAAPPKYNSKTYAFEFASIADAQTDRVARVAIAPGEDDLQHVKANERVWLILIMNAIESSTLAAAPLGVTLESWDKYQQSTQRSKATLINAGTTSKETERRAWMLLDEICRIHTHGMRNRIKGLKPLVVVYKCSARIRAVIDAVKGYPVVATDVLLGQNIDQLCAAPAEYIKQKIAFKRNNDARRNAKISGNTKRLMTGEEREIIVLDD